MIFSSSKSKANNSSFWSLYILQKTLLYFKSVLNPSETFIIETLLLIYPYKTFWIPCCFLAVGHALGIQLIRLFIVFTAFGWLHAILPSVAEEFFVEIWALKSRQLLNIDKSQISRLFGVVNSKYCFSKNVDITLCFLHISLTNIIFSSLSLLSVKSTTYKIDSLVTIYACQRNRIYMWVPQLCCCLSQLKGWPMILRGCNRARPAVFPARPLWFFISWVILYTIFQYSEVEYHLTFAANLKGSPLNHDRRRSQTNKK